MYIYNKKLSRERKVTLTREAGMVLTLLFFVLSLTQISGTNSFFTDSAEIKGIEFRAGKWIPTLEMEVDPEEPDGEDGWYTEPPCVKFSSDMDDVTIYYSFTGEDETIDGEIDEDTCIYPPVGESELSAWAVNEENDDWLSDTLSRDFKVEIRAKEGEVIINELMWMGGAQDEGDEWIELRNMTDRDIDLSNWDIMSAGKGNGGHIEIPHGYEIKAGGYFLITAKKWKDTEINLSKDLKKDEGYTHVSGMDLKDEGEQLVLRNKNKEVIDTAWQDEQWPDGFRGEYLNMSMERDEEIRDGEIKSSWHTCSDEKCNDEEYWKKEGVNFGTPGKKNSTANNSIDIGSDEFEINLLGNLLTDSELIENIWAENFGEKKIKKREDVLDVKNVENTGDVLDVQSGGDELIIKNEELVIGE